MDTELLNKISNLAFYGFYDPSKNMVTVHFFNENEQKPDIIAYLRRDMSWDVREIIDEVSILNKDSETVTILHKLLGIYQSGGPFDKLIRRGLEQMACEVHGDEVNLLDIDKMFCILENNSYDIEE